MHFNGEVAYLGVITGNFTAGRDTLAKQVVLLFEKADEFLNGAQLCLDNDQFFLLRLCQVEQALAIISALLLLVA